MASAFINSKIATHEAWVARVRFFAVKAAIAVMAEDPETMNHAERVAYAKKVLHGETSMSDYAWATITNSAFDGVDDPSLFGITDQALEFTVNSMFNAMAGVAL